MNSLLRVVLTSLAIVAGIAVIGGIVSVQVATQTSESGGRPALSSGAKFAGPAIRLVVHGHHRDWLIGRHWPPRDRVKIRDVRYYSGRSVNVYRTSASRSGRFGLRVRTNACAEIVVRATDRFKNNVSIKVVSDVPCY